jgi:regulatory protein YycI of two-component signal transduction system YycFG
MWIADSTQKIQATYAHGRLKKRNFPFDINQSLAARMQMASAAVENPRWRVHIQHSQKCQKRRLRLVLVGWYAAVQI